MNDLPKNITVSEIKNKIFGEERALYALRNAHVVNCAFEGAEDGESAMKESSDLSVSNCRFSLRYPLWHSKRFTVENSDFALTARAPLWYCADGEIHRCDIKSVKCLRECDDIKISDTDIVSPEFGWKCRSIVVENSRLEAEYIFFDSENITLDNINMKGKYSFQYVRSMTAKNSVFDTKDAFWHSKSVTVRDSVINGEYLGWYSEGLTLINCTIRGTQPLCYCKNLTLVNCTMENADLAFEYSDVNADIRGRIMSVKNPRSGKIVSDGIDEIILSNSVMPTECEIITR